MVLTALVFVSACVEGEQGIEVQGVTETTITVGNTAATSGALAFVGLPFNAGIEAYFKYVNDNGGVNGRMIEFVHYDDGFDQATGISYTKKLVEEDEVFALVGHFGTPTVSGTLDYINEVGVPMVYAATGINGLYFESSPRNPIFAVQPIYKTDGRLMTARALFEDVYGVNGDQPLAADAKVGVLHTTTDDGVSIKEGIEVEAALAGRLDDFIFKSFSADNVANLTTAITELKAEGVSAIIVASNQAPFKVALAQLEAESLHVPVFTSYVNADATSVDNATAYSFDIFANAWLDVTSTEGVADVIEFSNILTAAGYGADGDVNYTANAFAIAGYVAAYIFVQGLERVGDGELTWRTYIEAMEASPISVPMGGTADFTDGKRWGVTSMSLLKLTPNDDGNGGNFYLWVKEQDIQAIDEIRE
jgi:ABC-type branched-subunit amino acid transport system substrate-binding protein